MIVVWWRWKKGGHDPEKSYWGSTACYHTGENHRTFLIALTISIAWLFGASATGREVLWRRKEGEEGTPGIFLPTPWLSHTERRDTNYGWDLWTNSDTSSEVCRPCMTVKEMKANMERRRANRRKKRRGEKVSFCAGLICGKTTMKFTIKCWYTAVQKPRLHRRACFSPMESNFSSLEPVNKERCGCLTLGLKTRCIPPMVCTFRMDEKKPRGLTSNGRVYEQARTWLEQMCRLLEVSGK